MSPREVEELDARGWAGTSERQVREWLGQLPLVDGIAEVVEWCLRHDVVPALATLAWYPVGSYLCETFGFVDTCGPLLEVRDGIYTGIPLSSCDEYAKRDFAERFAKDRGFSLDQCLAVGDSFSDLPLFEDIGLAVAFNATERARALADVEVTGDDLRAVLPHLESWLA